MAIEYIEGLARRGVDVYTNVNELSECVELDDDFRIILFRIEALYTDKKPLVDNASVEIKRAFWKDFRWFSSNNMDWAVAECQQYGTVNTYLDLLYRFHENRNLTPEQLLEKMQRIDVMERGSNNSMTDHYLKEFKERIEEDLHQALADHGIDANLSQHHVEKLNASYDAISVTPEGSHIGVNANLSAMFEAIENGQDYNEVVSRASELM